MKCEEAARLLDPYLDGELDLTASLGVEEHLAECPECRQALEARQSLVTSVLEEMPRFTPSPFLATRIRASLREEQAPAKPKWKWTYPIPVIVPELFSGLCIFAIALIAAVLMPVILWLLSSNRQSALVDEAMSDHIRSLQVSHLMDVASTDQHTVKPWFMGKLDYSPQVVDLTSSGYPLVGGRLDFLDHRTVAAIIYQRRKHDINLFIWPETGTSLPTQIYRHNGYHFLGWTKSGMNYLAVSDLVEGEFADFVKMIQAQTN